MAIGTKQYSWSSCPRQLSLSLREVRATDSGVEGQQAELGTQTGWMSANSFYLLALSSN